MPQVDLALAEIAQLERGVQDLRRQLDAARYGQELAEQKLADAEALVVALRERERAMSGADKTPTPRDEMAVLQRLLHEAQERADRATRLMNERCGEAHDLILNIQQQHAREIALREGRFAWLHALLKLALNSRLKSGLGLKPASVFQGSDFSARVAAAGLFDPEQYLAANSDVKAAGLDPLLHYVNHGLEEGRMGD